MLKVALATAAAGVMARPVGAAETKTKKYTKERVGYRDEPYEGRTCSKCVLYAGEGECAIVEGKVSPTGWCVQWTPATVGGAAASHKA
jgi:hypothetical protein